MQTFVINKDSQGYRLDKYIKKHYPTLPLTAIYKMIRTKKIKVNKKKVDIAYKLIIGDNIDIFLPNPNTSTKMENYAFKKAKDEFSIVYEDKNIICINKPIGVVVQDDDSKTVDTLNNRLLKYLFDKGEYIPDTNTTYIPSFVHRLDRNTSGLILASKNLESSRILSDKIKKHEIEKYYLCRVYGLMETKQGTLVDYLTKDSKNNLVKVSSNPLNQNSKKIITEYKVLSHDKNTSLLEIHLVTGKTHQIRAHMNFINHPLVGEKKYTNIYSTNKEHQNLIAYKIIFNFQSNAGVLQYLNKKELVIKIKI